MKPFKNWAPNQKAATIGLAPMEGVLDALLRDLLTGLGGFDFCVTEFIRVTDRPLPDSVFYDYCPELHQGGLTHSGVPVVVQLLGGNPEVLALNAARACELGAPGIDLNFGCPAKTVNRHDGGAVLLKTPERIKKILEAVRKACPPNVPVSAKIRLGFDSKENCVTIAQAAEAGGATWLTVHARTRLELYRPPAHWEFIDKIRRAIAIPVIANGDVWSPEDARKCVETAGTPHLMLGRGALARPALAREIEKERAPMNWLEVCSLLEDFVGRASQFRGPTYALCRMKQWLRFLSQYYPEAQTFFSSAKLWTTLPPLDKPLTFGHSASHS